MMRADEGFQSDQAGGRLASFHQWHATIMPILQSAASNLIRTPSSRSDMSGYWRWNTFRAAGVQR